MMDMTFRATTPAEFLYTADQGMQIEGQTGCIGHVQADAGADGQGFSKTWINHQQNLMTKEFQQDLEGILDTLTGDELCIGMLTSREIMSGVCWQHPESSFEDGSAFGFRTDTAQYSFLIRIQPHREKENLLMYCYRRDWLDDHMKKAERGIRFIDPHYREKFRIPDGDKVQIRRYDGAIIEQVCRYIDDSHVQVGKNLYHICEFAEIMERNGNSVIPIRSSLPLYCYGKVPEKKTIVAFVQGSDGYRSAYAVTKGRNSQKLLDELNSKLGVNKAQAAAMQAGATLGWDAPAADPKNYDEQGQPIKPRHRDRGDAR